MTPEEARRLVVQQYAATGMRMAGDPEWERLLDAAVAEELTTPRTFFARNMLAIRREIETPMFP